MTPLDLADPKTQPSLTRLHVGEIEIRGLTPDREMEILLDVVWEDDQGRLVRSDVLTLGEEEVGPIMAAAPEGKSLYEAVKVAAYDLVRARLDVDGTVT